MSETRFQRVESKLNQHENLHKEHGRRLTDHETTMSIHSKLLDVHQQQLKSQAKLTVTLERTIDVGERIIEALGWAAKIAKWTLTMAAFFTAVYQVGKAAMVKIGF